MRKYPLVEVKWYLGLFIIVECFKFLLYSIMRRKYMDREIFQFSGFIEFRLLGCLEHYFIIFTKYLSVTQFFFAALEKKLIGGNA